MKYLATTALMATLSLSAHAQTADTPNNHSGFNFGVGFGPTIMSISSDDDSNFNDTSDPQDMATRLFAGYRFNRIVGIEATRTNYGEIAYTGSAYTEDYKSFSIAANIGRTFNSGWRGFGVIGLGSVSVDASNGWSDTGGSIHFGGGVEYAGKSPVGFRAGIEADLFSLEVRSFSGTSDYAYVLSSVYAALSFHF